MKRYDISKIALTQERDELRADVERLRKALASILANDGGAGSLCYDCIELAKARKRAFKLLGDGGKEPTLDTAKLDSAITEALGEAYDCIRVWSAWGYGTMGPDDFRLVAGDPGRVAEIRDAVLKALSEAGKEK